MKHEPPRDSVTNVLLPLFLILGLVLLLSLNPGQNNQLAEVVSPLEKGVNVIVEYLAIGAKIAAAVTIGGAILRGVLSFIGQLFSRRQHFDSTEVIRLQLRRALALGLEFTVASDILYQGKLPSWKSNESSPFQIEQEFS